MLEEYQYGYTSYYGKDSACNTQNGSPVATIRGYVKLAENNYTELMNAIAQVGPVASTSVCIISTNVICWV